MFIFLQHLPVSQTNLSSATPTCGVMLIKPIKNTIKGGTLQRVRYMTFNYLVYLFVEFFLLHTYSTATRAPSGFAMCTLKIEMPPQMTGIQLVFSTALYVRLYITKDRSDDAPYDWNNTASLCSASPMFKRQKEREITETASSAIMDSRSTECHMDPAKHPSNAHYKNPRSPD